MLFPPTTWPGYKTSHCIGLKLLYHATESVEERHKDWYSEIRSTVSDRISNEEERVPSHTSMWCHWLRSCWVSEMWRHAPESDIFGELNPPGQSGWKKENDGSYDFDWDSPELQEQVKGTIEFLTMGCSCKKGCKTGQHCGPGCNCHCCTNLFEGIQSQTTKIWMTNLMPKVRRQARRIRTHNAQVALRMKRRMV